MSETQLPEHDDALTDVASPQRTEIGESLSEMLAQLTEGVATLTVAGAVISWNPSATSLTGYSLNEINDKGFWHLFDPPDAMMALVQQAHHGTPVDARLVLVHADGRRLPMGIRCCPLRHLDNSADRVMVVLRDFSDMEALHNQLLQSERLGMLGRLAGAVSHEIRNPLTAIFLQTDILEDEIHEPSGGNREQILRSLHVIKEEVSRLHELVQQYLSLARLSNLQRETLDFSDYLTNFCKDMQGELRGGGIVFQHEALQELGEVDLHPNSFRRVLLNLIHNAVEAMPDGGFLTLVGYPQADAVRLELRDTGCGIPPEQMSLLFSPLYTTKPEGTGLGLYLVREIVLAHDGDIELTSELGMGTTFIITLPRRAT